MPEFLKKFSTEVECEAALKQTRWPQDFVCSYCSHTGHSVFKVES
ncbi:transposase [Methylobacter sp. S3L5C]|nr:transposase [Methylobacter sp. S3L5C]UOA09712.1 transposase [Methylobacter sp. S3L5C]